MAEPVKTILLVEDEAIIAIDEARSIGELGYRVVTASSGEAAVRIALGEETVDLILMDIDLGRGMDGTDAAREILNVRAIPVVFLSSHTEKEIVEKTEKITSYGYVVKNSGITVLDASLKMAFRLFEVNGKLRASEAHYRIMFESTGSSMILVEEDMTISMMNEEFARQVGYPPEEIIGRRKWTEFVHPDDLEKMIGMHRMRRVSPESAKPSYEFRYLTRSGETRHGLITVGMLPGTKMSVASIIDITDRHRAEEESLFSRINLEATIENTDDIIASYDHELRLLVYNRACSDAYRSFFGVELYPGFRTLELFPESMSDFWNANSSRALAGESFPIEFSMPTSDGQVRLFESFYNPIRRDNRVIGFSTFTRDITGCKHAEDALRHKSEELLALNEELTAANIKLEASNTDLTIAIRELQKAEDALVLSESRLNKAQEIAHVGNWEYDVHTGKIWGSDEAFRMYGLNPAPDNLINLDEVEAHVQDKKKVQKALWELIHDDIPYDVEITINPSDGSPPRIMHAMASCIRDENNAPLRAVGIVQDITERKHTEEVLRLWNDKLAEKNEELTAANEELTATNEEFEAINSELIEANSALLQSEEALRESREEYRNLSANVPIGIITCDTDGKITFVNRRVLEMLGSPGEEETRRINLLQFPLLAGTEFAKALRNTIETGKPVNEVEMIYTSRWGKTNYFLCRMSPVFRDGRTTGVRIILDDITDRKRAEHQARERTKELQAFFYLGELAERDGITLDGLYQELVEILPGSMQYPENACARIVIGGSEHMSGNYMDSVWKLKAPLKVNGALDGFLEVGYREERPQEDEGPFLKEERMLINAISERVAHIYERSTALEKIRKNEAYLAAIIENQPGLIWLKDREGRFLAVNHAFALFCGKRSAEEVIGLTDNDIWHHDLAEKYRSDDYEVMQRGVPVSVEEEIIDQGVRRWFETFKTPVSDDQGKIIGTTGYSRDITGRKQAAAALAKNEAMLRSIFDAVPAGVVLMVNRTFQKVNAQFCALTGYSEEELIGRHARMIYPSDEEFQRIGDHLYRDMETKGLGVLESQFRRKDDSTVDVLLRISPIDPADLSQGATASVLDITDRRLAERERERALEELRAKTEELDRYFTSSLDLLCIADTGGHFIRLNPEWEKTLGYPLSELEGKLFLDLVHPDDLESTLAAMSTLEAQEEVLHFVNRYRCRDGSYRWIEWRSKPQGETIYAAARDITERVRIGNALREREQFISLILETAQDGFGIFTMDGNITEVNDAMCRMLGYERSELLQQHVYDLVADEDSAATAERIMRILENGAETFESRHRRRDGTIIDTEVSVSLVRGMKDRMFCFMRDISARKEAEEQIKSLLAEKELVLREVHHRIKNNMSVMMGLLTLQAHTITDPAAVAALNDAHHRMLSMDMLYDRLYRSENLHEMSIRSYLTPLVHEIVGNFPNAGSVRVVTEIVDVVLGVRLLSSLGIIVNELITNAMKHAFVERRDGTITVSASHSGGRMTLSVGDNGKGIPETMDIDHSDGFGLKLIGVMIKQIKADMKVVRGGGTRFVMEFDAP